MIIRVGLEDEGMIDTWEPEVQVRLLRYGLYFGRRRFPRQLFRALRERLISKVVRIKSSVVSCQVLTDDSC